MAKTTIQLDKLTINKLSKELFEAAKAAGEINENEIYMTPDNSKLSELENDVGYLTEIPKATASAYGGIKASVKSTSDTVPVNIGTDGKLYVPTYPTTLPASDVSSWAKSSSKPTYTKDEIGLGNVENKSSATIRSELTNSNVISALGFTPMNNSLKGAKNGVAELDTNGKVPSTQLPSYVDDVLEYTAKSVFPATGESGKIYVDITTNKTYRWSGTTYVEIAQGIGLGETTSTAYAGNKGKANADEIANIKNGTTVVPKATDSSTVNGYTVAVDVPSGAKFTDTVYTHPSSHAASIITQDTTHRFVSDTEKSSWDSAKTHADSTHAPSNAEVNQNAFSNVKVGTTTVASDTKTDTLELVAGSNVTITPDATNDRITISSTDTKYTHPSNTARTSGLYKITVDNLGHVTGATSVAKADITTLGIPSSDTNTHYESKNVVGTSTATSNTSTTLSNGNVYLNNVENGAVTSTHKISGSGATTVTTDASGNIIINSTDTDTKYTHPSATAYSSGLYKITTNALGHVTSASAVTKNDITALGIPGSDTNTTYNVVSKTANGLAPMLPNETTTTKYLRQDGTWVVPPDTNTVYTHPTTAGNKHIPTGGASGQILKWSASGTATWANESTGATYSDMSGATTTTSGTHGLVPAPSAGNATRYLRSDGTWQTPPDNNTTYSSFKGATSTVAGGTGLVPAPAAGAQTKYLRADGTWQTPPDNNTVYTHPTYTSKASGLYKVTVDSTGHVSATTAVTKADITSLGIPGTDTDTVYTHPTTSGNKHIPSGGASGQFLKWSSDGTATWTSPPSEIAISATDPASSGAKIWIKTS